MRLFIIRTNAFLNLRSCEFQCDTSTQDIKANRPIRLLVSVNKIPDFLKQCK